MKFHSDDQTIDDLRIFGKNNQGGLFDLYNQTCTRGGEKLLKEMFLAPLSDRTAIQWRSNTIEHFAKQEVKFPFDPTVFDFIEKYLADSASEVHTRLSDRDIQNGVLAVLEFLRLTKTLIDSNEVRSNIAFVSEREKMADILRDPAFEPAFHENTKGKMSYSAVTAFDILFRVRERGKIRIILGYTYQLDVYLSVASLARAKSFVFPKALEKGMGYLNMEGVYHPELKQPVRNDILFAREKNVMFLTGANMAGKSTLLRSVSTAVYIAHIGFPVAARSMEFSVLDGLYTTINLPDNLGAGASHFYAEVLRLKKIVGELQKGRSLFVVFDELFRGTNVKDAQEATVAVTTGFSGKKSSLFVISSHIVEAAEQMTHDKGIFFEQLPTSMNGSTPSYTYRLKKGITGDRHGMVIIRNEGILEILKEGLRKTNVQKNDILNLKAI